MRPVEEKYFIGALLFSIILVTQGTSDSADLYALLIFPIAGQGKGWERSLKS